MELDGIPSIWDGWEKQCFGRLSDPTGAYCALGYVLDSRITDQDRWETFDRVRAYIRAHYPQYIDEPDGLVIIRANNELKLTPDDFRRIDRLTQYEEGMRQIQKQIEEVRHDVSEVSA